MMVVCVLAVQAFGAEMAAAASKNATKSGSNKADSARGCTAATVPAVDEASRRRASRAVICLVNRARRAHGAAPLRRSKRLTRAAAQHSAAMVGGKFFSHRSSTGDVRRRAVRAGYLRSRRQGWVAETLSWGAGAGATPAHLVAAFMGSRSHRRTLLSRRFRHVGVGLALGAPRANVGDDAATLTIDLGRR